MENSLSNYLHNSIRKSHNDNVNESFILASLIAGSICLNMMAPVLNSNFMTTVGAGLGTAIGNIGSLFGFGGKKAGYNKSKIEEILKKDPDDMTGEEKEYLQKVSDDPRIQKEFSNNQIKAINDAIGRSSDSESKKTNDDDEDDDEDDADTKDDTTTSDTDTKDTDEKPKVSGITFIQTLAALAAHANKNEKDEKKKAENDALIDLATASCYGDDDEELDDAAQKSKLKELVGEDNWDDFVSDISSRIESTDNDALQEAIENANKNLTPEEAEKMAEEQKSRAKEANDKIKKDKQKLQDIDDELKELEKNPEDNKDRIEELKKERETTINSSVVGQASPKTAKATIEHINKTKDNTETEEEPKKEEPKKEEPKKEEDKKEEPKKEDKKEEPKKDENGNIVKKETVENPETGKSMTVTTHTGPRGGKYYISKHGKKVYVKEENEYIN